MANTPFVTQAASSGGTTVIGGQSYPVAKGFGALFGGPAGAIPRDINLQGGLIGYSLTGKTQGPILSTLATETVLATGTILASATTPTRIEIVRGMDRAEFTRISFRDFVSTSGAASPASLAGRLYRAPPVNGVWSDDAAICAEVNLGGLSGYKTRRVNCTEELSEAVALWYRPVTAGPATLSFSFEVWGYPRWHINQPIPVRDP